MLACLVLTTPAHAAPVPGSLLTNTATASWAVGGTQVNVAAAASLVAASRTPAVIEFLGIAAPGAPGAASISVQPTQCGGAELPAPHNASAAFPVPGDILLAPAGLYVSGSAVFVRLTDPDQNLDGTGIDHVKVTVTGAAGDTEVLTLAETGPSTGVFVGYVQAQYGAAVADDCALEVAPNAPIQVRYVDALDGTDISQDAAMVDPYGIVFDSGTGAPVNGAAVTLVDAATGAPAPVFCLDGVTPYPSRMVTGESFPACGGTVSLPAGSYQFPLVSPGTYRLDVVPPSGYFAPSVVVDTVLQALPGAPWALATGSRGETFSVPVGPALQIDIPLDTFGTDVLLTKSVGVAAAGVGDFVSYSVSVHNPTGSARSGIRLADTLPAGFRLQVQSAKLDGAPVPVELTRDGQVATFTLGDIPAGATRTLRYVAQITSLAPLGYADNSIVSVPPARSNTGRARILVKDDLFSQTATLIGQVRVGSCGKEAGGLAKARVLLEDGTFAMTDKDGFWHINNVVPGTHVVQLDRVSLPEGWAVMACPDTTRKAGRSHSEFVNVRPGSLWRADFAVRPLGTVSAAHKAPAELKLVETLPYDGEWVATQRPGIQWLHPRETFYPAIPAIKLAVKHNPRQRAEFKVNQEQVPSLNFTETVTTPRGRAAVSLWGGVPLKEGANLIELAVLDEEGKIVFTEKRTVHYVVAVEKAEFLPQSSVLVADGKSEPVIAIRFTDRDGRPARRGSRVDISLNAPYQTAEWAKDPLTRAAPAAVVGEGGVALVRLAPTTQTGEVVVRFSLGGKLQEHKVWLSAGLRDWVLVGLAEGSLHGKKLLRDMQPLGSAEAEALGIYDKNRIAFYAKGVVNGDALLTMAYDSAKQRTSGLQGRQAVDPNAFYTLYGDASTSGTDAPTSEKLYLKLERRQFYALFGDYETKLTVTELARYDRSLHGLKAEWQGTHGGYSAFAASTRQASVRDDLRGDGTTGMYRLTRGSIVANSDKLRIEVRDRFHSETVLSIKPLTRYLDYDLDPQQGTFYLREPAAYRDGAFNPVYIVAEYEAEDARDENPVLGGRAYWRPQPGTEAGVTLLADNRVGGRMRLSGVDVSHRVAPAFKLRAEAATSSNQQAATEASGTSWLTEALYDDGPLQLRGYVRKQDKGFGVGQSTPTEAGTRKSGIDGRYSLLGNALLLTGQVYRIDALETGGTRSLAEGKAEWTQGSLSLSAGLREVQEQLDDNAEPTQDTQATLGAAYTVGSKLVLRAGAELSLDGAADGSAEYPERYTLSADYRLSEKISLFGSHEIARGGSMLSNTSRVGIRAQPWTGGEAAVSLGAQPVADGERLFANLGMTQTWRISPRWQVSAGIEQSFTVDEAERLLDEAPPSSGGADFLAGHVGASHNAGPWSANGRIEARESESESKRGLQFGWQRTLAEGRSLAAGLTWRDTQGDSSTERYLSLRGSYAYRPADSDWTWLDRIDLTETRRPASLERKLVNNLHGNWKADGDRQLSLQLGTKFGGTRVDGVEYQGLTTLAAAEIRQGLGRNFDVGAHGSRHTTWNGGETQSSYGVSLGAGAADNAWAQVGYNWRGYADPDFDGANTRTYGFFVALRIKFDQDSLGLNDRNDAQPASTAP